MASVLETIGEEVCSHCCRFLSDCECFDDMHDDPVPTEAPVPPKKRRTSATQSSAKRSRSMINTITPIALLTAFWKRPFTVTEVTLLLQMVQDAMEETSSVVLQQAVSLWTATKRLMKSCMSADITDAQLPDHVEATISPPNGPIPLTTADSTNPIFITEYPGEQGTALLDLLYQQEREALRAASIIVNPTQQSTSTHGEENPFSLDSWDLPASGVANFITTATQDGRLTVKSPPQNGVMCWDLKVYPMQEIADLDPKDYWHHVQWSGRVVSSGPADPWNS